VKWFAARSLFALTCFDARANATIRSTRGIPALFGLWTTEKEALSRNETCWALVNVGLNDVASHPILRMAGAVSKMCEVLQGNVKAELKMGALAIISLLFWTGDGFANEKLWDVVRAHLTWLLNTIVQSSNVEVQLYGALAVGVIATAMPSLREEMETFPGLLKQFHRMLGRANPLVHRAALHSLYTLSTTSTIARAMYASTMFTLRRSTSKKIGGQTESESTAIPPPMRGNNNTTSSGGSDWGGIKKATKKSDLENEWREIVETVRQREFSDSIAAAFVRKLVNGLAQKCSSMAH